MKSMGWIAASLAAAGMVVAATFPAAVLGNSDKQSDKESSKVDERRVEAEFRTSDRCVACHNGMKSVAGEEFNIGMEWRASLMANSSRDPYWQASVRRETLDHPEAQAEVEDECGSCHMATEHLTSRDEGQLSKVFVHLPLQKFPKGEHAAADGVTCSTCHQAEQEGLGTRATFNGNIVVAKVAEDALRPEYGPYVPDGAHQKMMQSSSRGYVPEQGEQIRSAALCASCHTLYTTARGPGGKKVGELPEQMPYQEWQHSKYSAAAAEGGQTCQECHMPVVAGQSPVTALFGPLRDNPRHHVFVGVNYVMLGMLNDHRDDLATVAEPKELKDQVDRTKEFLRTRTAKVTITSMQPTGDGLAFEVQAENLSGHKLPTAYPSRRAWLHVVVRDGNGSVVFESGKLNGDGSIVGNDNDEDPLKFEPYYSEITRPDQVEIYEAILHDMNGKVTTGLLAATDYAKDDRLLPAGFDKATASKDVHVIGDAANDPAFTDKGSTVRYVVPTYGAAGPFEVEAELWFQPIGYRWAHNLAPYQAMEPQRMLKYYEQSAETSAVVVARTQATSARRK
ncbi:MAG: hypothetical protein M3O31_08395 [Acidobacteriota bacterium]|nr:hypothetical protein [Acidobacteriota bacterium]